MLCSESSKLILLCTNHIVLLCFAFVSDCVGLRRVVAFRVACFVLFFSLFVVVFPRFSLLRIDVHGYF